MTGWLIALGIIVVIAVLPVGASVRYDESGPAAQLIIGPVRILLFPRPQKKKKTAEPSKESMAKKEKPAAEAIPDGPPAGAPVRSSPAPEKNKGGSWTDFLPLVDVALDLLNGFKNRLRVNYLQLQLILAGEDPADLAVNYGRAQAAGAALLAQMDRFFVIKRQDVDIQCDFTADEMKVLARLDLTMSVGRALNLVTVYGIRALRAYMKIKKQRQGGASI